MGPGEGVGQTDAGQGMTIHHTPVKGVTIDGPTSRDLDDAIWYEDNLLPVTIAGAASHVPPNSPLDQWARRRGFTRYWAGGNDPMLPTVLSEDGCSLLPGVPRDSFTAQMSLDPDTLEVADFLCFPTKIVSAAKMTYLQVDRLVSGGPRANAQEEALAPMLCALDSLAQRLLAKRRGEGALAIYDLKAGWRTTEEGHLVPAGEDSCFRANIIVQECMILANQQVAALAHSCGIPILYRNHEGDIDRDEVLSEMAALLEHAEEGAMVLQALRGRIAHRLPRARYGVEPLGHFGLNLRAYTHITSPLRRYPDLVNWHNLSAYLTGQEYPYPPEALSEIAAKINEAEDRVKDKQSGQYKPVAAARARKLIAKTEVSPEEQEDAVTTPTATALSSLSAKDFQRVVKVAVREGRVTEMVADEYLSRLAAGSLLCADYYLPLMEGLEKGITDVHSVQWRRIVAGILAYLEQEPQHARSILGIAQSTLGFGAVRFADRQAGEGHALVFQAQAYCQVPRPDGPAVVRGPACTGTRKQVVRHRATLGLLRTIIGQERVTSHEEAALTLPIGKRAKERPAPLLQVRHGNYVSALNEYVQKAGGDPPTYTYEMIGEPHEALFTAVGRACGLTAAGEPAREKSAAKQSAAQALCAAVMRRLTAQEGEGNADTETVGACGAA